MFLRFSGTKKFGYNDRYIRVEESSQRWSHSKQKVGLRPKIFLPLCKCTVFKFSQEAFWNLVNKKLLPFHLSQIKLVCLMRNGNCTQSPFYWLPCLKSVYQVSVINRILMKKVENFLSEIKKLNFLRCSSLIKTLKIGTVAWNTLNNTYLTWMILKSNLRFLKIITAI